MAALDKFRQRPPVSPPGEQFHYSSFGFTLVSAVIEGAAGEPFLDYMDAAVFGPLGMERTTADRYEMVIPHRTGFYEVTDIGVQTALFTDNSDVWAGGGFLYAKRPRHLREPTAWWRPPPAGNPGDAVPTDGDA